MSNHVVQIDGKNYAMVEWETPFIQSRANPVLLSRREVLETIARLERRVAQNHPKKAQYQEKLAAFKELLNG